MPNTRLLPWDTITHLRSCGAPWKTVARLIRYDFKPYTLKRLYQRRILAQQNSHIRVMFPKPTTDPDNPANWRSYKYPHDWCTQVAQKQKRVSLR